jgi:peroxiredoxin Q/BCP
MATLTLGSKLPAFTGIDQNGVSISSADFAGKNLVIYFYPKDDTPGCTAQACSIRDGQEALLCAQVQVIGVSADSVRYRQNHYSRIWCLGSKKIYGS